MLELAVSHAKALQNKWRSIIHHPQYKYLSTGGYFNYEIKISDSTWERIQCVSLDSDRNVIGYMSADFSRTAYYAYDMTAVNFAEPRGVFGRDLAEFIDRLFTQLNMNKILWCVVVGNPAQQIYRRYTRCGARIAGYYRDHFLLEDKKLYDKESYEWMRDDYLAWKNSKD